MLALLPLFMPGYSYAELSGQRFDCLIEPYITTQVGSPVQGTLEKLMVERGELVTANQAVAQLHSSIEQANLKQAAARAQMEGELRARQADLNLASHQMKRMAKLYEKNMVSAQQRDEVKAQLQVASAALEQARDNVSLLKHDLTRNQQLLDLKTVRSPINGVIVERLAFPGEFVYDNPIVTIAQLDPLRVEVVLPATAFGQLKTGDFAKVFPELGSGKYVEAHVEVVDKLLDSFSGTFGIRLTLPNPDTRIISGQKCEVEFSAAPSVAAANSD